MKAISMLVLLICLLLGTAHAGVVIEAKDEIADAKHEALVQKAKKILERKTKIEAELKQIEEALKQLDAEKDVEYNELNTCTVSQYGYLSIGSLRSLGQ